MRVKPSRQCAGCRTVKEKRELLRIIRAPEGEVRVDADGRQNGRGAYVCSDKNCLARVRKTKALERALKTRIPDGVYDEIERWMERTNAEA